MKDEVKKTESYEVVILAGWDTQKVYDPSTIYLIKGGETSPVYAKFLCPCGCGLVTTLPLTVPGVSGETWDMSLQGNIVTISPSIQVRGGCGSHYFIRDGKVVWC